MEVTNCRIWMYSRGAFDSRIQILIDGRIRLLVNTSKFCNSSPPQFDGSARRRRRGSAPQANHTNSGAALRGVRAGPPNSPPYTVNRMRLLAGLPALVGAVRTVEGVSAARAAGP